MCFPVSRPGPHLYNATATIAANPITAEIACIVVRDPIALADVVVTAAPDVVMVVFPDDTVGVALVDLAGEADVVVAVEDIVVAEDKPVAVAIAVAVDVVAFDAGTDVAVSVNSATEGLLVLGDATLIPQTASASKVWPKGIFQASQFTATRSTASSHLVSI